MLKKERERHHSFQKDHCTKSSTYEFQGDRNLQSITECALNILLEILLIVHLDNSNNNKTAREIYRK